MEPPNIDYDAKSNKLLEVFETTLTNYQEVFVHHGIYLYDLNFAINVQSIDCIAIHQLNEHIKTRANQSILWSNLDFYGKFVLVSSLNRTSAMTTATATATITTTGRQINK